MDSNTIVEQDFSQIELRMYKRLIWTNRVHRLRDFWSKLPRVYINLICMNDGTETIIPGPERYAKWVLEKMANKAENQFRKDYPYEYSKFGYRHTHYWHIHKVPIRFW